MVIATTRSKGGQQARPFAATGGHETCRISHRWSSPPCPWHRCEPYKGRSPAAPLLRPSALVAQFATHSSSDLISMVHLDIPASIIYFWGFTSGIAVTAFALYLVETLVKPHLISNLSVKDSLAALTALSASPDLVAKKLKDDHPASAPPARPASASASTHAHDHNSSSAVVPLNRTPSFDAYAILPKLDAMLNVSSNKLQQIVLHMVSEMRKGLHQDGEKLKMIPSFVVSRPTGNELGTVLALDLGGSNFRVCQIALEGQGRVRTTQRKYVVSDSLKTGPGAALFDFFAECVAKFLEETGADPAVPSNLGFTFSFPVQQTAINAGTLMHWNKGFQCSGVVGEDVVGQRHRLVNDTVGTLMAHAYTDPNTYVGVILGTGTNAAYVERLEDVPKWKGDKKGEMIINTEWGAYDEPTVLPISKYDQLLDRFSGNPKSQIFEKMFSGMYLGEIVRLILVDLVASGELFHGRSSVELAKPYHFDTAFMSRIERDHSIELSDTKNLFEDILGIPSTTIQDRRIVKHVCELVGTRAARLSAAGVAAVITKINRLDACTVAIDGSLFEHYPHFGNRMRDALREILGITAENIILEQARDGSGQGAALIAALHPMA
ncbi:hexokinase-domain-containing protein [Entophlyctis helioformis]|nr:hexokinase-domain-containing protein [Entophlyctis helioformis]